MNRRSFFSGAVLSATSLPFLGGQCMCQEIGSGGCVIDDSDLAAKLDKDSVGWSFNLDKDPVFGGSGNRDFDQALAHTLSSLCDLYSVLPGFAFFNEDEGPNAFASPSQRLHRQDGSVVFGQTLLAKLMQAEEHPAAGVAAVCAHEFGHILQYKNGIQKKLVGPDRRAKRLELHADFLAGFFSGLRKISNSNFPASVFANTQYNFGDSQLSNVNHHGTPEERGRAVVFGFKTAFQDKHTLSDAVSIGINYVSGLPG